MIGQMDHAVRGLNDSRMVLMDATKEIISAGERKRVA
jgi:hypothetical protein